MPNRLAGASSPYLRQHAQNPVDWYPWGEEAFAKAQLENKPVFLSVGYASCHWCHVMERESFEDERVAAALNEGFVCVKVDREERPDVDEAYMTAVQLQSGRGGWPMSVFLTPDRKPFFAGTYFPKEDRGKHPGFLSILSAIAKEWATRKAEVQRGADRFAKELEKALSQPPPGTFDVLDRSAIEGVVRALWTDFDRQHGGFGGAPKFPPHSAIEFLLAFVGAEWAPSELRAQAMAMSVGTLEAMALGGIRDHVGGGFHRYSTDERWLLPHFEKTLYDNALLLGAYARAAWALADADAARSSLFLRTAQGIARWLDSEMRGPDGLYYSALDADTEGEEGKFYVWTEDEAREALGERAEAFLRAYCFRSEGNFRDEASGRASGANIPHLERDVADGFEVEMSVLRESRARRVRPEADDKALAGWNGMAIAGFAAAGVAEAARGAAQSILDAEKRNGGLPHQVVRGEPSGLAYLDDYAHLAFGLLELYGATGEKRWADEARRLCGEMIERFWDASSGAFFATSDRHEALFGRTKPAFDQPTPSANSVAIRCLLRVGETEKAREALQALFGWMQRAPTATEGLYLAGLEYLEVSESEAKESTGPKARREAEPADAAAQELALDGTSEEPEETGVVAPSEVEHVGGAPAAIGRQKVEIALADDGLRLDSKGVARGTVVVRIPEGQHINSPDPPVRWLVPTSVEVDPGLAEANYPPSEELGYFGEVRIPFSVRGVRAGAEVEVRVSYQACTDRECFEPETATLDARIRPN